jgi:hypothetical protein
VLVEGLLEPVGQVVVLLRRAVLGLRARAAAAHDRTPPAGLLLFGLLFGRRPVRLAAARGCHELRRGRQ